MKHASLRRRKMRAETAPGKPGGARDADSGADSGAGSSSAAAPDAASDADRAAGSDAARAGQGAGRGDAPRGPRRAFAEGVAGGLPFVIVGAPFGMLFGVVATEAGLDLLQTMVMTTFVIAGASQFAMVELLNQGAPALVALAAALAVNLRMAMYSASLAPHLGASPFWLRGVLAYCLVDQSYGLGIRRFTERPGEPTLDKAAYFIGCAAPVMPCWIAATWLGAVAGGAIPPELSIDFAPPVTFIAIFAPMLRGTADWAAAAVAVLASLLLDDLPWSLGLILAAALGMATGALVEIRLARRRAARGETSCGTPCGTGGETDGPSGRGAAPRREAA